MKFKVTATIPIELEIDCQSKEEALDTATTILQEQRDDGDYASIVADCIESALVSGSITMTAVDNHEALVNELRTKRKISIQDMDAFLGYEIDKNKEAASKEFAMTSCVHSGDPSYRFEVGDSVSIGALKNCVVDEVCEDGKYYGIKYGKDGACYGYWSWLDVRPIPTSLEAKYAQKDSPLFRMSFSNRSIESLLHMYYYFGVDMEPDYQRGSFWNDEDRVKLLDSIFAGREIGRFVFREVPYEESLEKKCMYEVVDGKQRLMTLCAFYENRFPYRGCFYNELPAEDKNWFGSAMTSLASLSDKVTKKEVLEVFVALNQNGRPIEEAVLNHAKKLLDDIR